MIKLNHIKKRLTDRCCKDSRKAKGFTLIEMLVTIAVLVIVVASMPSLLGVVKNGRLTANANNLLFAFVAARDEAVLRNHPVSICPSNNQSDCSGSDWQQGWIVFADQNGSGDKDGDDAVLQVFASEGDIASLSSSNFDESVTFRADGTSAVSGGFTLCDDRGTAHAKAICVAYTGIAKVTNSGCSGVAISCPDA
jgi:type IV fimbrial biogenesis protein FimT